MLLPLATRYKAHNGQIINQKDALLLIGESRASF